MIRDYHENDKAELIRILKLNTPKFFAPTEENDFINYLENFADNYFVIEHNQVIIGSGGINFGFNNGKTARIAWDIIHPEKQGKGFGTELVNFRINEIKKRSEIDTIIVRTTQLVYRFYEKHGFQLKKIEKNYWANGIDLFEMENIVITH